MATQAKFAMRAVKTISGIPIPRYAFGEKALSTFTRGAVAFLDSSGRLTECSADPALIVGVATGPGGNNATDFIAQQIVELADQNTIFRGYADTSAAEGTGVLTTAAIGQAYGLAKSAVGGFWFVDIVDVTNDRVVIWGSWDEAGYALPDVRPHVYFSFRDAQYQMNIGT